ncbi:Mitochondrial presequence protease, partial [Blastomyces gilchristii]
MLRSTNTFLKYGTSSSRCPTFSSLRSKANRGYLIRKSQRLASTVTQLDNYPAVGEKLHGFTVKEKKHVPELHLTAVLLKHDKTEADYLHVARDDKNNVF